MYLDKDFTTGTTMGNGVQNEGKSSTDLTDLSAYGGLCRLKIFIKGYFLICVIGEICG